MIRLLVLLCTLGFPPAIAAAGTILIFGDSVSVGYGLAQDAGWVRMLSKRVAETAPDYKVLNASISGETASGGRRRLAAALDRHRPAILILELGGNDGLRGTPVETIRADLESMVKMSLARRVKVVLVGMELPPNYGATYVKRFRETYTSLAAKHALAFVPFLFDGFGEKYELFQADGIHPTREAQPLMLENVWKALAPLIGARTPAAHRR